MVRIIMKTIMMMMLFCGIFLTNEVLTITRPDLIFQQLDRADLD
uniref:Uncharacterized protein n=3 Tax=Nothobranchius TaxID=28779 RepID=A0A1A8AME1_NOTFU